MNLIANHYIIIIISYTNSLKARCSQGRDWTSGHIRTWGYDTGMTFCESAFDNLK